MYYKIKEIVKLVISKHGTTLTYERKEITSQIHVMGCKTFNKWELIYLSCCLYEIKMKLIQKLNLTEINYVLALLFENSKVKAKFAFDF